MYKIHSHNYSIMLKSIKNFTWKEHNHRLLKVELSCFWKQQNIAMYATSCMLYFQHNTILFYDPDTSYQMPKLSLREYHIFCFYFDKHTISLQINIKTL